MTLNRTYDNNIGSFGYNTSEAFMTVHASQNGIFTVDKLKGKWIYVSNDHFNRIKKIQNDPRNPLLSMGVYRTDITAGRTHVCRGIVRDVYFPVNVTTADIAAKQFVMVWRKIADKEYRVLLERAVNVKNLNDINKLEVMVKDPDMNVLSDTVLELHGGIKIHVVGEISQYQITWKSNMGKRILAVFKNFTGKDVKNLGLGINTRDANAIHAHWKILEKDGVWYRWTYINGDCVCTEEFQPDWFAHNGKRFFIMSQVNSDGDIIASLFEEGATYRDVKIHASTILSDFDLKREVLNAAPRSQFRIPKQVRELREDKFRE